MNHFFKTSLILFLIILVAVACSKSPSSTPSDSTAAEKQVTKNVDSSKIKIGVAMRRYDDTFLADERKAIATAAEGKGQIDIVDSQASQTTQNDKVDLFITKKYLSMGVNLQEPQSAASGIIDKAKKANVPVVFFNAEPPATDLQKWDKAYYVGAKAEESGIMQGQILIDYWKSHPEADKNKDGVIQYIMLKGDPSNDAELRTKFSIKTLQDAGFKVEKVGEEIASWDRVKGQEKMAAFLASNGDKIEAVFGNNDDMALGAIEALKAQGYFTGKKFMPVIGVDATVPGLAALKDGSMLGTVLNDSKNQGTATFNLLLTLAKGEAPTKANVGYDITDNKYIWIPYKKITKENMAEVK